MNRIFKTVITIAVLAVAGFAQERATFTGTAVIYGNGFQNTRTVTRTFTMRITGISSDQDVSRYLNTLQERGQKELLDQIRNNDLGRFSLGSGLGSRLNAVSMEDVGDGRTRIRAVFERWIGFGELRGGYRSVDYPFGYVELYVDRRTGKGEGTFIPAAQIRFKNKNGGQVEIEDFGTFPGRLMGVTMRGRLPL